MVVVRFVAVIPSDGGGNVVLHPVTRRSALLQELAFQDGLREVDTGDLDDSPPRGFLAGAIMKVWAELRINLACEPALNQGEGLPGGVGSERLMCETVNCLAGVILK